MATVNSDSADRPVPRWRSPVEEKEEGGPNTIGVDAFEIPIDAHQRRLSARRNRAPPAGAERFVVPRSRRRSAKRFFYDFVRRILYRKETRERRASTPHRLLLHHHRFHHALLSSLLMSHGRPPNKERRRTHLRPLSRKCSSSTFILQHRACLKTCVVE